MEVIFFMNSSHPGKKKGERKFQYKIMQEQIEKNSHSLTVRQGNLSWCIFSLFFFPSLVIGILGTDWVGWIALNARH